MFDETSTTVPRDADRRAGDTRWSRPRTQASFDRSLRPAVARP